MMYATEEERVAARRKSWAQYNRAHRAERSAHNKTHVQKEYVKARRRERYTLRLCRQNNVSDLHDIVSLPMEGILGTNSMTVNSPQERSISR